MLRKATLGRQKGEWTRDEVLAGLKKFYDEYRRFPKVSECDAFPYLPSSRSIQRSFGGVLQLKKELGIDDTYHSGDYRRQIVHRVNKRGMDEEERIQNRLIQIFGEIAVHKEQPVPRSRERLDFVVYHSGGKFGVDVFYPADLQNLKKIVNIKVKKYHSFIDRLFLVCTNQLLTQSQISIVLQNKIEPIDQNVLIVNEETFINTITTLKALNITG